MKGKDIMSSFSSDSEESSHINKSFTNEISSFLKSWNSSKGNSQKTVDNFIKTMKNTYKIEVVIIK
jgi:flagellar hook-basal body complex protein FliE